jgi:PKD repeat protein
MTRHACRLWRTSNLARSTQIGVAAVLAFSIIVVAAWAAPPVPSFTFSPSNPVVGEQVRFTSTSTDPDNNINRTRWDLDNDGSFDDGSSSTVTRTFTTTGSKTVRLEVRDGSGTTRTTSRTFTVNANGAPVPNFAVSPASPLTGQGITLTSTSTDPEGRPLTVRWDTNNNNLYGDASGSPVTIQGFSTNGPRVIGIQVTDSGGLVRTLRRTITIGNRLPVASFSVSATEVDTGESIRFSSTSTDPDGQIQLTEWDFDGDGQYDDASGSVVTHSFSNDGNRAVGLKVTDNDGGSRITTQQVTVRNRPPTASFTYSPNAPFTGDEVVLTSTSTDPDGQVARYEWDLDDDGEFDDAEGSEARVRFDQPGSYQVGLRVRDDDGRRSSPVFDTIDVLQRPAPPPPGPVGQGGTGDARRRTLIPFPRVRIRGVTTATGARIDLLGVRTPGGTRILVRCRGVGCPYSRRVRRARFPESQVRTLRLPGFRRRYLAAGTVLRIFIIDDGVIGKYTRFDIRRAQRPPRRIDRCAVPGRFRVRRCPA